MWVGPDPFGIRCTEGICIIVWQGTATAEDTTSTTLNMGSPIDVEELNVDGEQTRFATVAFWESRNIGSCSTKQSDGCAV